MVAFGWNVEATPVGWIVHQEGWRDLVDLISLQQVNSREVVLAESASSQVWKDLRAEAVAMGERPGPEARPLVARSFVAMNVHGAGRSAWLRSMALCSD